MNKDNLSYFCGSTFFTTQHKNRKSFFLFIFYFSIFTVDWTFDSTTIDWNLRRIYRQFLRQSCRLIFKLTSCLSLEVICYLLQNSNRTRHLYPIWQIKTRSISIYFDNLSHPFPNEKSLGFRIILKSYFTHFKHQIKKFKVDSFVMWILEFRQFDIQCH